jgi:hypothetical protein
MKKLIITTVRTFRSEEEWNAFLALRPERVRRSLEITGKATVRADACDGEELTVTYQLREGEPV